MTAHRQRAAAVDSKVSRPTAAHVLQRDHDIALHEAEPRPGGHTHTHDVASPDGRLLADGAIRFDRVRQSLRGPIVQPRPRRLPQEGVK